MEQQPHGSLQNSNGVGLGTPAAFSYSALCSNTGFSTDAGSGITLHTDIPNSNTAINVSDILNSAVTSGTASQQNIVIVASGSGTTLTDNTGNITFSNAGGNQPLLLSSLDGGQNTIITFHTLPFVDGASGHELIVTDGNVSHGTSSTTTATVDLTSPENAALLHTLLSQGVTFKAEDSSLLSPDKSNTVDVGQLIDFIPSSIPHSLSVQDVTSVNRDPSQLASASDLSQDAPLSVATDGEEAAGLSNLVTHATYVDAPAALVEFTDDTPIFTKVCATLNPDVLNNIVGSRDFVLDQLWGDDHVQLGMDNQQSITLESSVPTLTHIHNKLKDLLNIQNPTRLLLLPTKSSSSYLSGTKSVTVTSVPSSRTSQSMVSTIAREKKKVEEKLTPPRPTLITSRGRVVKVPRHFSSAVASTRDIFGSDESEEDIEPTVVAPQRRKRGRPRKGTVAEAIAANSYAVVKNENIVPSDLVLVPESEGYTSDNVLKEGDVALVGAQNAGVQKNSENIADPVSRPGVLRKAHNMIHVSQATQMRRIYEGRIKFKFFCSQCSFKSKRESHYNTHMKLHESGTVEVHKCGECNFKTIRLSHLRRHELLHKSTLLKCNICGYMTDTSQMLLKHTKLKHPNGQISVPQQARHIFRCEVCGHSSSNRNYFTRHLMRHAQDSNHPAITGGPDGFQCPQCQRTFQRRVHLERHMRDVHGPQLRPHLCDICGKSFKRSDALQQHKISHTSRALRHYPFHCSKCNKGFKSQAHLKEHQTRHSSERPYLCQYCGASFKTPSVQRKHILSLHLKPRAHPCLLCNKKFNTPYALTRHHRTHKIAEQKLGAVSGEGVVLQEVREVGVADGDQQVTTLTLGIEDEAAVAHLQQVTNDSSVVTVTDADDTVALVGDVMPSGMEEALGEGDSTLQTQYIVQGNETTTALFYLTGSL